MKNGKEVTQWGVTYYWENNHIHRENGPATEWPDGSYIYRYHNEIHRLDGPAEHFRTADGGWVDFWLINGKLPPVRTQEEFEQYIKLKAFW